MHLNTQAIKDMVSPGFLLTVAAGFCLGRAILLGELAPFAPAFAAACAVYFGTVTGLAVVMAVCAGLITVCSGSNLIAGLVTSYGVYFFVRALPDKYSSRWQGPVMAVLAMTLSVKAVMLSFSSTDVYSYINALFEAVFAGALTPALILALKGLGKINGAKSLSTEEVVCVLALIAGVVAGTGDLSLWQVSVKGVMSRLIIMAGSLAGGPGLGAAAGALVGVIPGLAYVSLPLIVGSYSFSGVTAGLGKIIGKPGVVVGFLLGNIILSVYVSDFTGFTVIMAETLAASLVFLLIPMKWVKAIAFALPGGAVPGKKDDSANIIRGMVQEKISRTSSLFKELSKAFSHVSATAQECAKDRDLDLLVKEINNKVCHGCGMCRICWEKDYYRTYQHIMEMFATVETFGRTTAEDMPHEFRRRCTRPKELAITVSCLYDVYKLNSFWREKLSASRGLVGVQLSGLADIIENMSGDLDFSSIDYKDGDILLKRILKEKGYHAFQARMADNGMGKEVFVTGKACTGAADCRYKVAPAVSGAMDQPFYAAGCVCSGLTKGEVCSFRLYQGLQFDVEVGVACAGRDGSAVSGDSYTFSQLRGGRFAIIMSDGMGSGEKAAAQSTATIGILKKLMDFGLGLEAALKTVNSILMLRLPEENFSTVDMAVLNLYSGQGEIIKIASPPSYLIRGKRVTQLQGNSLPVGIVSDIEISAYDKKFISGDILVMVTDGIADSRREAGERDWLADVMKEAGGMGPGELAELLVSLARGGEGRSNDDMTAVAVKIIKQT
jgi:stage II sporulation protein E